MNSVKLCLTSQGRRGTDLFCRLYITFSGISVVKIRQSCTEGADSDSHPNNFICNADRKFFNCERHWAPRVLVESWGIPSRSGLPRCPSERELSQLIPNRSRGAWVPPPSVSVADCNLSHLLHAAQHMWRFQSLWVFRRGKRPHKHHPNNLLPYYKTQLQNSASLNFLRHFHKYHYISTFFFLTYVQLLRVFLLENFDVAIIVQIPAAGTCCRYGMDWLKKSPLKSNLLRIFDTSNTLYPAWKI